MQPESPATKPRRNWHLLRWAFVLVALSLGWGAWKAYDFRKAVEEAKKLGWDFRYKDLFAIIAADWRAAFRKDTWKESERTLFIEKSDQMDRDIDLVHRLSPQQLTIGAKFPLSDLSRLKGLSHLTSLALIDCPKLTNIDALKDMKELTSLVIAASPILANIEVLKELKKLEQLDLGSCSALTNLDALRELKALERLDLMGCTGLKNVDGLLGLTQLGILDLRDCHGITNEALATLKAALPNAGIVGPD